MELDGVGGLLQEEPGEVFVPEIGRARGEEGQQLQKAVSLHLAVCAPEVRDDLMGDALHALILHGDALLVDALRRLEGDIHAREVVHLVGDAVVPAEVENGPGVRHEAEMVFAHEWMTSFQCFLALARSASQRASRWRSAAVWALE